MTNQGSSQFCMYVLVSSYGNGVMQVYSPHVDLHQRLTLLEALAAAARQLASGGPQTLPAPDARSAFSCIYIMLVGNFHFERSL